MFSFQRIYVFDYTTKTKIEPMIVTFLKILISHSIKE